ncbi:MAG: hypothetical protein NTW87_15510 [Planctomycetota bacterium]|nr:hypothetical protein [Planctomycetota bacterium]
MTVFQPRYPSGNVIIIVIVLVGLLLLFALTGTILLRPAGTHLDLHHEFARAQSIADGALQKALANLDAGKAADFAKVLDTSADAWEIVAVSPPAASGPVGKDAATMELTATGKVRSLAPVDAQTPGRAWATVRCRARVRKDAAGVWRVVDYSIIDSLRETER